MIHGVLSRKKVVDAKVMELHLEKWMLLNDCKHEMTGEEKNVVLEGRNWDNHINKDLSNEEKEKIRWKQSKGALKNAWNINKTKKIIRPNILQLKVIENIVKSIYQKKMSNKCFRITNLED